MYKILIIISNALGDFINFLSFLEHLKLNFPKASITLITRKKYFEIFDYFKYRIDKLIDFDSFPFFKLYLKDFVIDKKLADIKNFNLIISFTGANDSLFKENLLKLNPNTRFIFPVNRNGEIHEIDYLIQGFNFKKKFFVRPHLILPESDKEFITIHPGSGSKFKNPGIKFFIELSKKLPYKVKFFGGENEMNLQNIIDIEICQSIKDTVQVLKKAIFYIGNDSGISHLASAFNIPSFVFFGPTSFKVWKPRNERCFVIRKNINCSPCDFNCKKNFECLNFDPEMVANLILNIYKNFFN